VQLVKWLEGETHIIGVLEEDEENKQQRNTQQTCVNTAE
jgi:hypothetical protein